jgi:hypothetical protein
VTAMYLDTLFPEKRVLWLIRKGHMGDVILTEPVARALRARYDHIVLFTEYVKAGRLLEGYDEVCAYSDLPAAQVSKNIHQLVLAYETYTDLHYLDGFAACAGVTLPDRMPRLAGGDHRLVKEDYCLIAPHTSDWFREMREWPLSRFLKLGTALEKDTRLRVVVLDDKYSFDEMLSLIKHCSLFVGNDSGPGIIAQCYDRPSVILFGATKARLVLFSRMAVGVTEDVGCNGCRHYTRYTSIGCASPLCLDNLSVETVINVAKKHLVTSAT